MLYTFRTFPLLAELRALNDDTFVFGKLKEDFAVFAERLAQEQPHVIIGVAAAHGPSRIERYAVNRFNRGRIVADAADKLPLFVPLCTPFNIAQNPTNSFCNWTMYRLAHLILQNGYATQLSFVHLSPQDFPTFCNMVADAHDA